MVKINIESAGKKFHRDWIFRAVNFEIKGSEKLAIRGNNGSGKSTLLQIIAGFQSLSSGSVTFMDMNKVIDPAERYRYISYAAPYLDLPEQYDLDEVLSFHSSFKAFLPSLSPAEIKAIISLKGTDAKRISHFSSGMKQRVKLALAILSSAPVLLLDEPLSNLDRDGAAWFSRVLPLYAANKTVVICSNFIEAETEFCLKKLDLPLV